MYNNYALFDKLYYVRNIIKDLFSKLIILYYKFKIMIDFLLFIIKIVILKRVFFKYLFNAI